MAPNVWGSRNRVVGTQTGDNMLGNWLKTSLLLAGIVALFGAVGAMLGGAKGMLLALVFGGATNVFAYWFSDKLVLRKYNARQVDEAAAPQFYRMIAELAQRATLPMPRVYLIDEAQPTRSPPDAIRRTLQSRQPLACCRSCRRANGAA